MSVPSVCRRGRSWSHRVAFLLAFVSVLTWSVLPAQAQTGRQSNSRSDDLVASAVEKFSGELAVVLSICAIVMVVQMIDAVEDVFHAALNLSQTQREDFKKIKAEMGTEFAAFQALPTAERRAQMLTALPQIERNFINQIDKILNDEQRPKFRQLVLQLRGPSALVDPTLAPSLNLTEEQQQKLAAVVADHNKRIQDAVTGNEEIGLLKMTTVLGLRKHRDKELLGLLTAEQKEEWTELKGKPHLDVEALVAALVKKQLSAKSAKPKADLTEPETPKPKK